MNSEGIMRRARRRIFVFLSTTFLVALAIPAAMAQAPPASNGDDLDVTMRVIVDPDAKVPDEIVRKISLPKPQSSPPATPPKSEEDKSGKKPDEPGDKGKDRSAEARDQGREFGQQTAEEARQRADETKRNGKPPNTPPPNNPPGPPTPPGPPNPPPRGPG